MKLDIVRVQNYRTLENVEVKFHGYYTAISGQNNGGKTSLIRAIRNTFKDNARDVYFYRKREGVTYRDDKTQWTKGDKEIVFDYEITVTTSDDPGLFYFIEKFSGKKLIGDTVKLRVKVSYKTNDETDCMAWVAGRELSNQDSKEILQKLKSSSLAFMHDSAGNYAQIFGPSGRHLHEMMFTADELTQISEEVGKVQKKIQKISKAHKTELSELLGHLEEKYDVDFAIPEGMFTGSIPFAVNLRDKNVDIPLNDWGSGTKNRTQILMSMLHTSRIKSKVDKTKITPFMIIEEPESFLHPSAQAEFGRVLIDLANQLQIQTIVTTHSPYMLCQDSVISNVLLGRKQVYGKARQTEVIDVKEDNWMEPFGNILGLNNTEFAAWKDVLFSGKQCVLLVEGDIDRAYFEHLGTLGIPELTLPAGIEIFPYGGKDTLKNAILLKFIVEKFKKVLVTFDLDAKVELERIMQQIGLVEGDSYLPIGIAKAGRECIEGLLPERILSKVHAKNTDLVMQMCSGDSKERKSAKSSMKQALLSEFKADKTIGKEDLKGFLSTFKSLAKLHQ